MGKRTDPKLPVIPAAPDPAAPLFDHDGFMDRLLRRLNELFYQYGSSAAITPLTTKGDIWGFDTADNRIPVGADTYVLTADSTQALGVKWAAASGSGGGTLQSQPFTASGTFTPASGVTAVWLWMIGGGGGGGGGSSGSTIAGGGGGAGELAENFMVPVSGSVTVTIGAAGAAGTNNTNGGDGGNTSFGSFTVLGGKGGGTNGANGAGGGVGAGTTSGQRGTAETNTFFGGGAGGSGGVNTTGGAGAGTGGGQVTGGAGGTGSGSGGGGGGGASSPWGIGGAGGNAGANNGVSPAGTAYGSGGGGGGANNGGGANTSGAAGIAGYCVVYWVA